MEQVLRSRWAPLLTGLVILLTLAANGGREAGAAPRAFVPVAGGSLDWGVKASFRSYIPNPNIPGGAGTTTLDGGATQNQDGTYRFAPASGGYDAGATTVSAAFAGSVHYRKHDYGQGAVLDIRLENLRVQMTGNAGFLVADVYSRELQSLGQTTPGPVVEYLGVQFAALTAAGGPTVAGSNRTWTNVAAALTAEGAAAFVNFYGAGEPMDPLSFTITLGAGELDLLYDADCNGTVDATDVLAVLRAAAGFTSGVLPVAPCTGDVTGGGLGADDALAIRRRIAELV